MTVGNISLNIAIPLLKISMIASANKLITPQPKLPTRIASKIQPLPKTLVGYDGGASATKNLDQNTHIAQFIDFRLMPCALATYYIARLTYAKYFGTRMEYLVWQQKTADIAPIYFSLLIIQCVCTAFLFIMGGVDFFLYSPVGNYWPGTGLLHILVLILNFIYYRIIVNVLADRRSIVAVKKADTQRILNYTLCFGSIVSVFFVFLRYGLGSGCFLLPEGKIRGFLTDIASIFSENSPEGLITQTPPILFWPITYFFKPIFQPGTRIFDKLSMMMPDTSAYITKEALFSTLDTSIGTIILIFHVLAIFFTLFYLNYTLSLLLPYLIDFVYKHFKLVNSVEEYRKRRDMALMLLEERMHPELSPENHLKLINHMRETGCDERSIQIELENFGKRQERRRTPLDAA